MGSRFQGLQYIDFGEVYNCLRGSRKLKIPPASVIPDRLG